MSEEQFSEEDRESLIRWMEQRGGNREQAEFAARQLMKRAVMVAGKEGIAPIEAMGNLLAKVVEAERVFSDSAADLFTADFTKSPENKSPDA